MTGVADTQAPLEAVLKDEILRMYQAVADQPESTFHFFHGREAAELFATSPTSAVRARPVSHFPAHGSAEPGSPGDLRCLTYRLIAGPSQSVQMHGGD